MNAQQIRFGIEIETSVPFNQIGRPDGIARIASRHRSQKNEIPTMPGWGVESDGSISPAPGYTGVEIVSPVLQGVDGLRQVKAIVEKLHAMNAKVNSSCGFHIHVEWAYNTPLAALQRLVHLVAQYEDGIFAQTGSKSRSNNHYCRPIKVHYRGCSAARALGQWPNASDRYHILNLENLISRRQPTVEFRAFCGTLNFSKMVAHIRTCIGLVEKAINSKRAVKWDVPATKDTSPYHRGGHGQTQLTRLFYALGWIKGDTSYVFGDLQSEGIPTLDDSKRFLMKLARQFDDGRPRTPSEA